MTPDRAAGPGPRTVAPPRVTRSGHGFVLAALVGALLATLTACGGPTLPSQPILVVEGSAPASAGQLDGSAAPGPSQPRWPGTTVLATIAMGAADGEIQKAGIDLQAAVEKQDLRAMWGAADGLAKMIDALMPNIDRMEIYEGTRPAAAIYRKALPQISAGAKQLRDSITSGDSAGVVAGSQAIARGLAEYAPVRRLIGALVEQAIVQQRLLVR